MLNVDHFAALKRLLVVSLTLFAAFLMTGCELSSSRNSSDNRLSTKPVGDFVTVLKREGDSKPIFILAIDTKEKVIRVRKLTESKQRSKSFELWAIGVNKTPLSLGTVDQDKTISAAKLGAVNPKFIKTITFAISQEPRGGSKTGQPTGPVLAAAKPQKVQVDLYAN